MKNISLSQDITRCCSNIDIRTLRKNIAVLWCTIAALPTDVRSHSNLVFTSDASIIFLAGLVRSDRVVDKLKALCYWNKLMGGFYFHKYIAMTFWDPENGV